MDSFDMPPHIPNKNEIKQWVKEVLVEVYGFQEVPPPPPPAKAPFVAEVQRVERMIEELKQLKDRRAKLYSFICDSPLFEHLPAREAGLMHKQHSAMLHYEEALEERIKRATA